MKPWEKEVERWRSTGGGYLVLEEKEDEPDVVECLHCGTFVRTKDARTYGFHGHQCKECAKYDGVWDPTEGRGHFYNDTK